jgi:lipoprotein-anchoring transpeptidase ErfK/SrfK
MMRSGLVIVLVALLHSLQAGGPVLNVNAINESQDTPALQLNSTGPAVIRAQILLDRAHFSPGEIDGRFGANAMRAEKGFREARGIATPDASQGSSAATSDTDLWNALNADTAPALTSYKITAADLMGPFVTVPREMSEKAKLSYLGYASPLQGIAAKFHSSPMLLRQLNPGKGFSAVGQEILVPNVMRMEPLGMAAKIVVSKSESVLKVLDATGKVIAQYPCTSGSVHDPLPIGEWKVTGVQKNPKFHYNPKLFWDAKATDAKATIPPGPRNPVGLVWIDLSKEHYGIHGTPDPSQIGHTESHGCIRLTNWDALELASIVHPGTPASFVE